MRMISTLPLLLAMASVCQVAVSQEVLRQATSEELIERLSSPPATRSLRNLQIKPKSIDLTINFDFDSAKLRDDSLPLLENLAAALKSDRLVDQAFKIEGHTDGKGTAAYNRALSLRRAQAVRVFLIGQGVSADRLESIGLGFDDLLFPDEPLRSENRRVRIGIK